MNRRQLIGSIGAGLVLGLGPGVVAAATKGKSKWVVFDAHGVGPPGPGNKYFQPLVVEGKALNLALYDHFQGRCPIWAHPSRPSPGDANITKIVVNQGDSDGLMYCNITSDFKCHNYDKSDEWFEEYQLQAIRIG